MDTTALEIILTDGDRVEARNGGQSVVTDQDGSAPAPFDLFLVSIGTCAGIYVSRFCRQRGISPRGVKIVQRVTEDPESGLVGRIDLALELPPDFPERYRGAVARAAELCTVKRQLARPPEIRLEVAIPAPPAGT